MIDAGPKVYIVRSPTPYGSQVKVTDLEFLYWSLCLSFYNVCFCEAFDGLILVSMVIETGPKFYMVPFPTQKVTDSEFLYKSFVINVLHFQFFLQSLQWILFSCGVTIEPCLKFYAVPSQSQCMTLKIKVTDFEFFCVKSSQCQLLQNLWLIWIVFGMNGYKILKCFRKEKRVSGELPCPATGLTHLVMSCFTLLAALLWSLFWYISVVLKVKLCIKMGITVLKIVIWGGTCMLMVLLSQTAFYSSANALRETKFLKLKPTIYLPKWHVWRPP